MITARQILHALMPPPTVGRYAAKLYLARFLGILLGLVAVLQMLDMMAVRDDIMAADGATWVSMWTYFKLRVPQLISQFIPFSALLATLLVLAALNQYSEIIVMKASGLSAYRILFPLGLVSLLIAGAHFAFNELYVIDHSARLQYWQDTGYGLDDELNALDQPPREYSVNARLMEGRTLILVDAVRRRGGSFFLDRISLYDLDDRGKVVKQTNANFAVHTDGAWTLWDVREFDPISHEMTVSESRDWDVDIPPERFLMVTVNPNLIDALTLYRTIESLRDQGAPTASLLVSLYHKFMEPLSSLLMPLLGAIAGFGVHRSGTLLIRVITGMVLGFAFFVADNFMMAMGQFGVAPPFLAATAPFILFSSVGLAVLLYTEE